jgi:predicted metal-dependent phosphoesterase TrpH
MEIAASAGISVVALTDHDTFDGLEEAAAAATTLGLTFVAGVEISTQHPDGGERHLLGYAMDPSHRRLRESLAVNVRARDERLVRMLAALAAVGPTVSEEQVRQEAQGAVGRPHVADALVRLGHVRSRQEAFDRWLGDDRPANVNKRSVPLGEAIDVVHEAGGVAVLAHPGRHWDAAQIERTMALGLDGLEAHHPSHSPTQIRALTALAARCGLFVTGGSDSHGDVVGIRAQRDMRVSARLAEPLLHGPLVRGAGRRA